ncbi:MAG: translation initiation factor IF-6 [Candidatus Ranarchaeia archaeon]
MTLIIKKLSIHGNPGVGAFLMATDTYVLLPRGLSSKTSRNIAESFDTRMVECTIGGSRLLGVYAVGNTSGCIVPFFTTDDELLYIRDCLGVPVARIPGSLTALGNIVLANDNGAIVHPALDSKAIKIIENTLKVPCTKANIAGSPLVGSMAVTMNAGTLTHPKITEEQISVLEKVLKVPVDIGTVMRGSPYVSLGLVANKNGAITSTLTTGPELARISQAFGFVV